MLILVVAITGCNNMNNADVNDGQTDVNEEQTELSQEEIINMNNEPVTFSAVDIEGNTVTSDIFSQSKLTLVNIWGTYCPPCIKEMPDLQLLYEELKSKNVNLIGIMVDVSESENKELAKNILKDNNVQFINIIPNEDLNVQLINKVPAVPTTYLINQEGYVIGGIVGSRTKEQYLEIVNDKLEYTKP